MPLRYGTVKASGGKRLRYVQWGKRGKKYTFGSPRKKIAARNKAVRQARAVFASGWKPH